MLTVGVTLEGDDVDLAEAIEITIDLWANGHGTLRSGGRVVMVVGDVG